MEGVQNTDKVSAIVIRTSQLSTESTIVAIESGKASGDSLKRKSSDTNEDEFTKRPKLDDQEMPSNGYLNPESTANSCHPEVEPSLNATMKNSASDSDSHGKTEDKKIFYDQYFKDKICRAAQKRMLYSYYKDQLQKCVNIDFLSWKKISLSNPIEKIKIVTFIKYCCRVAKSENVIEDLIGAIWPGEDVSSLLAEPQLEKQAGTKSVAEKAASSAPLVVKVEFASKEVKHVPASTSLSSAHNLPVSIEPTHAKVSSPRKEVRISSTLDDSAIGGTREQLVERAKLEAYVMQRVKELRKSGTWSQRKLPKIVEPVRSKTHWDYLLEEMEWLATDFAQERRWKVNSAKKCVRTVLKYHTFKQSQLDRAEKEDRMKLKKIASNIAKIMKQFWSDVEKIVETKQEVQLNQKRKKMHDMQLRLIVDKADHFTERLAQELTSNSQPPSVKSDNETIENEPDQENEEFERGSICSDDDEETIAKQEAQEAKEAIDYSGELNDLNAESEMPLDKLLAMYGFDNVYADMEMDCSTADETEIDSDSEESCKDDDKSALADLVQTHSEDGKDITEIVEEVAMSIQPKGNTLSAAQVNTKVPFLLKYSLREYQHVGLNWLAAAFEHNLNGILADEMGLGKTIQTIALIAHLACEKGIWGPHLIVVPTSVMLNWEMEFKKWCPGLKILTYYGSTKERKLKRKGWTKPNNFHVCITSYKLVIQDHQSFRRKKWVYMVLDEAQHIKNFKSQRWQMLLNFNSVRRLLLTGTPLQNTLLELWSLLHFLMPHVFESSREFKEWFANPLSSMIEGQQDYDSSVFEKLHKVLRPFILRRLKNEVEKQLPKKYEHIIRCHLSKRQRFLYDEYMSLSKTRETLAAGNFLSVINILMQLRKVCNHPNLFDPRPTVSPFIDNAIELTIPGLVSSIFDYQPMKHVTPSRLRVEIPLLLLSIVDKALLKSETSQMRRACSSNNSQKIYVQLKDYKDFHRFVQSKRMNTEFNPTKKDPIPNSLELPLNDANATANSSRVRRNTLSQKDKSSENSASNENTTQSTLTENGNEAEISKVEVLPPVEEKSQAVTCENSFGRGRFAREVNLCKVERETREKLARLSKVNEYRKEEVTSSYDGPRMFRLLHNNSLEYYKKARFSGCGFPPSYYSRGIGLNYCRVVNGDHKEIEENHFPLTRLVDTPETLEESLRETLSRFLCIVPSVIVSPAKLTVSHLPSYKHIENEQMKSQFERHFPAKSFQILSIPQANFRLQLPELRLIQYDCGKLQILDKLLCQLKMEKHRVLIFTQMSRMLDIFEQFLNYHGHTYLRLDGTTKIDQRQALMERFNADSRIFCFILSTRSGGVGVNLTGADTVIFYDSDWNPTMDAQAQDRCHRIGQTRDVHIYRLVSERTIEENILKKANQKKLLGDIAIDEGNFNTAFFKQSTIKDLFDVDANSTEQIEPLIPTESDSSKANLTNSAFEQALCGVEEENDVVAAKILREETAQEFDEFDENIPIEEAVEEKSPEEEQLDALLSQVSHVERYAIKYIENSQDFHELKQVEEEIEETKKHWQRNIDEWKKNHEETRKHALEEYRDSIMTVCREDATPSKVFISSNSLEPMPIWTPPTPPRGENDLLYIDKSVECMYDNSMVMSESQLPPIYVPKDNKRTRVEPPPMSARKMTNAPAVNSFSPSANKSARRTDDYYNIPKSPFDRSSSMISRFRRELLLMKIKLWPGNHNLVSAIHRALANLGSSSIPPSNLPTPQTLSKSQPNPNCFLPKLAIHEEFAMVVNLMYLQDLPFNLSIVCPGHTPNWDFASEQVNTFNCVKRSAKQCKYHFESILIGADDQRSAHEDNPIHSNLTCMKQSKSTKKNKNQNMVPQSNFLPGLSNQSSLTGTPNTALNSPLAATLKGQNVNMLNINSATQPLYRLSNIIQKMQSDNYMQYTREMNERFAAIKQIVIQKTQTSKSRFNKQSSKAHDFVKLLAEHKIRYDQPMTVEEAAARRSASMNSRNARANQARADPEMQARQHALYQRANNVVGGGTLPVANQSPIARANPLDHQPQQSQMLINTTANTASAQFQVQQALNANKMAAVKMSNLASVQANDGSSSTVTDPSGLAKFQINTSHIVNLQSNSPNVHQVTLPQTLSLVNQGVNPLQQQQQSSQHQELSSSLQQQLQQHSVPGSVSGQTGQYVLQSQPISTAVSLSANSQQKVYCVTCTASATNVAVSGITQSAQITIPANQALSSGQVTRLQYPSNQIRNLNLMKQQQLRQLQQVQQQQLQQQQQSSGVQMSPQTRQLQVPSVRAQNMTTLQTPTQRYQIASINSPAGLVTQSMITTGPIKQVIATTGMASATTTTSIGTMVSSPRILTPTSTQQIGGSIKTLSISSSGSSQQTNSIPVSFVKTISSGANVSTIQIQTTNASSLLSNSNTFTIPITSQLTANKNVAQPPSGSATPTSSLPMTPYRQIVMHRRPSTIPSSSTASVSASSPQVFTQKPLLHQSTSGTSGTLVTSGEQQAQHPSSRSSPNIISPMLHSSSITNKTNTFHFVSSNLQQPLNKGVLSPATVTVHQAVKQGNHIIMQSPSSGSHLTGQLGSNPSALNTSTNTSSSSPANIILTQTPQQISSPVKSGAGQHFIAVSSGDTSSSGISVNASTIKLLSTSAGAIALQHGQQVSSSSGAGLPHSITTPKGHIIISGHPGSITGSVVASASSGITANTSTPSLLQQPSNQASPSSQTLTFAIRTPTGQSSASQLVTLKNPSSTTGLSQSVGNINTHQTPALVAALAQPSSSSGDLPTSASGSTLLRTLTCSSTGSTKVVLMQPSQNTSLANNQQVSLISLSNAGSMVTSSRSASSSNKITTATQTSGSGLILSAATKVGPESHHFAIPVNKPTESPLIEALKSPTKVKVCKPSDQNEAK